MFRPTLSWLYCRFLRDRTRVAAQPGGSVLLRDDEAERTPQELNPGTELARAVYVRQKPLIQAGTVLEAEDIQVLRNWDVESVVVKTLD